jgi:mono/diheme cytochrome c family protein
VKLVVPIGIAAALVGVTSFLFFDAGPQASASGGNHLPNLARGEAIYAEACASCHGANLEGQPNWKSPGPDGRLPAPPHDDTGHTWHHPDRLLLQITALGTGAVVGNGYESNMPGFGGLYSEQELRDVLAWIKTQWPDRERDHQAQVTAQDSQSN